MQRKIEQLFLFEFLNGVHFPLHAGFERFLQNLLDGDRFVVARPTEQSSPFRVHRQRQDDLVRSIASALAIARLPKAADDSARVASQELLGGISGRRAAE